MDLIVFCILKKVRVAWENVRKSIQIVWVIVTLDMLFFIITIIWNKQQNAI